MRNIRRHFDVGSLIIIVTTVILFVAAVFSKGFTHDLLLEVAVFLVSIKLIIMSYKNIDLVDSLNQKLNKIQETLTDMESKKSN